MAYVPYSKAATAVAGWVADRMIENANDCDDDVMTYSTDEEVVMLYLNELASEVSKLLPKELKQQAES
jgi:hypothetical protein